MDTENLLEERKTLRNIQCLLAFALIVELVFLAYISATYDHVGLILGCVAAATCFKETVSYLKSRTRKFSDFEAIVCGTLLGVPQLAVPVTVYYLKLVG